MLKAKDAIIVDDEITLRRFSHKIDKIRYEMILANHDHLMPWMPWADTYHKFEDMLNFTEDQIKEFDAGKQFGYDIYYLDEPVGTIDIHAVSEEDFRCELGYWLDQNHTGKGIMTRVVKALTDYAMQDLNMHRVALKVASENGASASVAERLGFKREALLRDEQYLSGRFYDTIVYVKIKDATLEPEKQFPKHNIIVGGVAKRDGKYLLVQEAQGDYKGKWNLPAGFLDPGETIYEGAKREIREECGFDVELAGIAQVMDIILPTKDISLCIVFNTEIIGGEIQFDQNEILDTKWFSYDEILQMRDGLREYDLITNAISAVENGHIGHTKTV